MEVENKATGKTAGNEMAGNNQKIINAESLNVDATLEQVAKELKTGETLILDVGNNYFHQTDKIYDSLVTKGFHVTKAFRNGRNQIIVRTQEPAPRYKH